MTTYREHDLASVDTSFGVQIQHPRFLECVGAPVSAQCLGRHSAEWLHVMDHRDALIAVVQLQRDAGLMASNLTVLNQYVVALHRMSTEVMQCVFGQEYFPSRAVDDAAPVSPSTSGINSNGSQGHLASPNWSGRSRARYSAPRRGLPGLSQMSSAAVRLAVRTGLTGL